MMMSTAIIISLPLLLFVVVVIVATTMVVVSSESTTQHQQELTLLQHHRHLDGWQNGTWYYGGEAQGYNNENDSNNNNNNNGNNYDNNQNSNNLYYRPPDPWGDKYPGEKGNPDCDGYSGGAGGGGGGGGYRNGGGGGGGAGGSGSGSGSGSGGVWFDKNPCRNTDPYGTGTGGTGGVSNSSDNATSVNRILIGTYVALPPYVRRGSRAFTLLVSKYLNVTNTDFSVWMDADFPSLSMDEDDDGVEDESVSDSYNPEPESQSYYEDDDDDGDRNRFLYNVDDDNNSGHGDDIAGGGQRRRLRIRQLPGGIVQVKTQQQKEKQQSEYDDHASLGGRHRHLARPQDSQNRTWDMYHHHTDQYLVKRSSDVFWWYYGVEYACYYWPSGIPITNVTFLHQTAAELTQSLQRDIENGKFRKMINDFEQRANRSSYPGLMFTTDATSLVQGYNPPGQPPFDYPPPPLPPYDGQYPPPYSASPSDDGPSTGGTAGGGPLDEQELFKNAKQLDTSRWGWQRYTGLGLFLATFLCTCCLINVAAYRQRRLQEQEIWGNLATEQGVDELLRTGWKVKGSKMEIFDKAKTGAYQDDDSMLIGGFEETQISVGAAITVTHPESESTPACDTTQRS